jgi:hypothetical protein
MEQNRTYSPDVLSKKSLARMPVRDFLSHLRRTSRDGMLYAAKSGNKLPTIVQKVYLRFGKIVHEIAKNFFHGQLIGLD